MRKGAFALDFYRKSPLVLNRTVSSYVRLSRMRRNGIDSSPNRNFERTTAGQKGGQAL
jgi:hypothetical protein